MTAQTAKTLNIFTFATFHRGRRWGKYTPVFGRCKCLKNPRCSKVLKSIFEALTCGFYDAETFDNRGFSDGFATPVRDQEETRLRGFL
jgi:hypothetical protein